MRNGAVLAAGEKGTGSSRRGLNINLKTIGFWALSFLAPIAIFCGVAAAQGIYPFGDQSFLTEDLKYQYVDFYTWFLRVLRGEESVFYSTACGLGANTWGLYSYYLASPFNLLLPFFDETGVTLFVFVSDALKLGCMQLAASFYLRRRFDAGPGWSLVFGLGYTWSLWVATNLRNPMWMDALILLPLIMWAVWQLVSRDRWLPLCLLTAANVIVCWYTAYMTVIFCIMLTILEWACAGRCVGVARAAGAARGVEAGEKPAQTRYPIWRLALRFARPMAVALVLCAWTFIPTVKAMLGSGGAEEEGLLRIMAGFFSASTVMGKIRYLFTTQPIYMLRGLAPALYSPWHRIPQFYCGVVLMASFVAFFASKRVDGRTKKAAGVLAGVILACIVIRPLQAIWCGFREPSGFYSRPALFVAPTVMWMAGRWWQGVAADAGEQGRVDRWAAGLLVRRAACVAVGLLAVVDLSIGAYFAWKTLYVGCSQEDQNSYYQQSVDQLDWLDNADQGTYRFERTYVRAGAAALNEAMSCGYLGISSYSSAHNQAALDFLDALGYSSPNLLHVRYSHQNLAADALLGVKYSSSQDVPAALAEVDGAPLVNGAGIYQNTYALGLGYAVSSDACGAALCGSNPFDRQNSLASALVGHEVQLFKKAKATLVEDTDEAKTYQVTIPAGTLGYAYVECPSSISDVGVYLSIDGFASEKEGWRFQHAVRAFGGVEGQVDGTHTVRVERAVDEKGVITVDMATVSCDVYYLDLDALAQVTSELSSHQVSFSSFSGNGIDGTVQMDQDGWVMVSVPAEDGWTVTVNGREVQTKTAFGGAVTLVPVTAGQNSIQMRFTAPGLALGIAVTAVGGLALVGVLIYRSRQIRTC